MRHPFKGASPAAAGLRRFAAELRREIPEPGSQRANKPLRFNGALFWLPLIIILALLDFVIPTPSATTLGFLRISERNSQFTCRANHECDRGKALAYTRSMALGDRKRKAGPRTKSGRLSRAHKSPELRDKGTFEGQAKRQFLVNGGDSQLAATASGILPANGLIDQDMYIAALRYARAHALVFGIKIPIAAEIYGYGDQPPEIAMAAAREQIDKWNERLDPDERKQVANLAVFGCVPHWFMPPSCASA
jgi:hypothetical protein